VARPDGEEPYGPTGCLKNPDHVVLVAIRLRIPATTATRESGTTADPLYELSHTLKTLLAWFTITARLADDPFMLITRIY